MQTTLEILLGQIERYLERTGTSATAFGVAAASDGHLVFKLRSGKGGLTTPKIDRIQAYMAGDKSSGAKKKGAARRSESRSSV